ncbi:MAG TPA: alkaline phosphatase family protein [Pyrinomonadaceae bacterium]|nr:alkaline phosphatase family protein [Pyrinomonadaceae bacterium]
MTWREDRFVLAVGLDAAEPALVRELVRRGEMPALKALAGEGAWLRVESPARVGSGSVWPTFIAGAGPDAHGVYGEWCWRPDTMGLERYLGRDLKPFWEAPARAGLTVGVFDVPFMPRLGLSRGFEISEWGAHDVLEGRLDFSPAGLAPLLTGSAPRHPLALDRLDAAGPDDEESLKKIAEGCLEGVRMRGALAERLIRETRPQLAVVAFTEVHHASHYLWHAVAPGDSMYDGLEEQTRAAAHALKAPAAPALEDVYREVDRQVARLVKAAPEGALVLVFSLHGMRPARGIPAFLGPLLCESGFARLADWRAQAWRERAVSGLAALKRSMPAPAKRLYYRLLPRTATQRLARPTMMPAYDWPRTRAFALPTDQHGWVRVNLEGREARGVVPPGQYEATCREVEEFLRGLVTEGGRAVVREVLRTAARVEDAMSLKLPDIVVHWTDAAHETPLKLKGWSAAASAAGMKFTGQHALEGFCVTNALGADDREVVRAEELHRRLLNHLAASAAAAAG